MSEDAKAAGADHAGLDDLISKVKDGWMDFDVAISTTDAMKSVRSIARVLGPRGLMPTPKAGTVTDNIAEAIKSVKAGRVEFKMDKTGALAVIVGKRSLQMSNWRKHSCSVKCNFRSRPDGFKGKLLKQFL